MPRASTRSARATTSFMRMAPPLVVAPRATLVWLIPWASTTRSRAATGGAHERRLLVGRGRAMQAAADDDVDPFVGEAGSREAVEHGRQQGGHRAVAGGVGDDDGHAARAAGELGERRRAEGRVERRGEGRRQVGEVGQAGRLLELAGAVDRQAAPSGEYVGLHAVSAAVRLRRRLAAVRLRRRVAVPLAAV